LLAFFLISKATSIDYDVLGADVENTLDECLSIAEDAGRYLDEVNLLQGVNRRVEDEKLGACVRVMTAVDNYRKDHTRLVRFQDLLRSKDKVYLHELLKPLSKKMGDLLYIASFDGDDISDFRTICGNQSPTLIIVESTNGTVFGGYTDADWLSTQITQSSSTAFVFRLRPSFEQYAIISEAVATLISDNALQFGNAINIHDHALSNADSWVSGSHYDVDGFELNDGERYFQAKDWVAVKVEDL